MKTLKSFSLSAIVGLAMSVSIAAYAHDNHDHVQKPVPAATPMTCEQLNASSDLKNPDVKALKARCDAEKKKAEAADKKSDPSSKK